VRPYVASRNGAQGGTGSGYFALCVNRHMALDTDLALVELNVNDGTDRAYERVHRKILARATTTAMLEVLVENWTEKTPGEANVVPGRAGTVLNVILQSKHGSIDVTASVAM
jgi:hypothetical protein